MSVTSTPKTEHNKNDCLIVQCFYFDTQDPSPYTALTQQETVINQ
jgi:hypothetical protein